MLVKRYLHHLEADKLTPLQIVAVTFTEAAAAELRARIRRKVAENYPKGDDRVAELEAARIGTIHSLAAAICRQHPEAAQVPPDFTILDDLRGPIWVAERIDDALDAIDPALMDIIPYSRLRSAVKTLMTDPSTASVALTIDITASIRNYLSHTCEKLASSSSWVDARRTLMRETGPASDKMEMTRRLALEVVFGIEAAINPIEFVQRCKEIKLNAGSATAWGKDRFDDVKNAAKTIREMVSSQFKAFSDAGETLDLSSPDTIISNLRAAYEQVQEALTSAKRQRRLLDYNDLEIHALRALQSREVQAFYHRRWRAFLLDEFQDTNPIQAEILKLLLGGGARTVIVGDKNQSIYGFRRAEPALFAGFEKVIIASGGASSLLDTNYRSHPELISQFNGLFASLINAGLDVSDYTAQNSRDLHECEIERRAQMGRVRYFAIKPPDDGQKVNTSRMRRAEAAHISRFLTELKRSRTQILDPETKLMRAIDWRDIAVLARTASTLDVVADALAGAGIAHVNAGGGSLLQTREAKDGMALLSFLAETDDNLSLAAVLRSPFCSVSDRTLYDIMQDKPVSLWESIRTLRPTLVLQAISFLEELVAARSRELPSRILHLADIRSGYSAILANLPSNRRRSADWLGFQDLVTRVEEETRDVFGVARTLMRLQEAEKSRDANVSISRPSLETGNSVSLMTIHKSKGLEWPVVVVADLARATPNYPGPILFDKDLGVGLQLKGDGTGASGILHGIINQRRQEREHAEEKRVLYVACTRARDYLVLSASGGSRSFPPSTPMSASLEANSVELEPVAYTRRDSLPPAPEQKPVRRDVARRVLGPVSIAPAELPVTSIGDYLDCPKKFHYRHILGHRGLGEGDGKAAKIGTLVHLAIQHDWRSIDDLVRAVPDLAEEDYEAAMGMAEAFRTNSVFAAFRSASSRFEAPIRLEIEGISLTGRIDLLGRDYIADFKTDTGKGKWRHRMQLWAYSESTGIRDTYVIHLRGESVEPIQPHDLKRAGATVNEAVSKIATNNFEATPEPERCKHCAYNTICPSKAN
jgi:ATP-dependent helicase/nuclease subunit A